MRIALSLFVGVVISAITVWGVGALYFSPLLPDEWRAIGAGGYALATILLFLFFCPVAQERPPWRHLSSRFWSFWFCEFPPPMTAIGSPK
jgi:hypothetical protein